MQPRTLPFTRRFRVLRRSAAEPAGLTQTNLSETSESALAPATRQPGDAGRWLLSGVAVMLATNGFLGDWNRTHLFNPRWTPHSKYHDGLTLLLGAGMGALSLRALWRKKPDLETAALLPAIFWAGMAGSFAFPSAGSIRVEFPDPKDRKGLAKVHEGVISAGMLALTALGYALSRRRPEAG